MHDFSNIFFYLFLNFTCIKNRKEKSGFNSNEGIVRTGCTVFGNLHVKNRSKTIINMSSLLIPFNIGFVNIVLIFYLWFYISILICTEIKTSNLTVMIYQPFVLPLFVHIIRCLSLLPTSKQSEI